MEESEDNMSGKYKKDEKDIFFYKSKPKKRSLVERELETNLTERVTSPIIVNGDSTNTSRYGRARRLKTDPDSNDTEKAIQMFKSPFKDKSPIKSPVYKMHASNSPIRIDSPNKMHQNTVDHQIESIYNENISLSRFSEDNKHISPVKQSPKVYVRKDLIQTKEKEETITLIKNYSPKKKQKLKTNLNNASQKSCDRYSLNDSKQNVNDSEQNVKDSKQNVNDSKQNGYRDNASVVKTLDFDGNKKKKTKEATGNLSKSDMFELEAKCEYQVGDLAWAKMGTYPYWPCIVTRDPYSGTFIKKKLFGRVDRDVIHVTFFGDNGRRSWIVDNMLRKFLGQLEFETTREKFALEAKKKDSRFAAFFVSEKKMPQWTISVEEAESLLREPKRLRIDLLNDMLNKVRPIKTTPKESKKVTRTDSDVSLSESLYDTLFSEDDSKVSDIERSKNKTRNKSLDVSDVVTACLDNMAAKTGITKIQKQSHMDRWLQKAKSKTPEKSQLKSQSNSRNPKQDVKKNVNKKNKKEPDVNKSFRFTLSDNESLTEVDNKLHAHQNEHDYSMDCSNGFTNNRILDQSESLIINSETPSSDYGMHTKVESLSGKSNETQVDEVLGDVCVVDDETVANSNNVINGPNEINNVITNDDKTIDDEIIPLAISCTTSKSQEYSNKICTEISENRYKLNEVIRDVNDSESISSGINICLNTSTDILDTCKSIKCDNSQERKMIKELHSDLTNGQDKVKDDSETRLKHESEKELVSSIVDSNGGSIKNNMKQLRNYDNLAIAEVQKKKDVNIAKTIINDKLVDNNVDFNKIDFSIEVNETAFIVNDDSDLKIPETNGHSNRLTTIDDCNELNNYSNSKSSIYISEFFESSKNLEGNSNAERYPCEISKTVHNKEITFTHNNNSLVSSVNNVCSNNILYEDICKKSDDLKENGLNCKSVNAKRFSSTKSIAEVTQNVFPSAKDGVMEIESNINCMSYLSSEEDNRSVNSTPTSINGFSKLADYNTMFMKKNYKLLTLQDALVQKEVEIDSDILNEETVSHEKFVAKIKGADESNSLSSNTLEDIHKQDEITTEESEHCSTDSRYASDKINILDGKNQNITEEHYSTDSNYTIDKVNILDDRSQHTTEESEHCSTDSLNTCDFDDKSVLSDAQTETTGTTESTESTEKIDEDESTSDSLIQHGYSESIQSGPELGSIEGNDAIHIIPSEEKTVLNGDQLRFTSDGLEITNETYESIDASIEKNIGDKIKGDNDIDTASTDSEISLNRRKTRWKSEKTIFPEKKTPTFNMDDPDFIKYLEFKQDAIYDEHPELSQEEITIYLYNTWLYEESLKTDRKKTDDIESASMVKGLHSEVVKQPKKVKKRIKVEKEKGHELVKEEQTVQKQKPKRRTVRPSYNEDYTDIEEDLEVYSIPKIKTIKMETEDPVDNVISEISSEPLEYNNEDTLGEIDEVEEYFARLTDPKPNVFKGLLREKVCEICEKTGKLVKCKGCSSMFHVDCVKKETVNVEIQAPMKGRKKKRKFKGRKSKSDENCLDENQSEEKDANISEEIANTSTENIEPEPYIIANAEDFETQLVIKMKELLGDNENIYNDTFSSGDELDWSDTEVGKCEIIDIKLRKKEDEFIEYSDFKCNNCHKNDVPICFVCRSAESPKNNTLHRQRCQVPQCNKYFHLECLEHWPQTQFNTGECARYNKKINEYFEALTCPRHVCHTCVSDDPRGCKTRFSGDKLARCVRCPATYHTFTKCLPAGSQILTGSHIICPRHHEHRPGKNPCHVNTGWCFICALGGTLICCEYCPTSFHAECLNIKPPEGGYMCEDCETGRLPLYGEMVWVKLGHYRWWPGIILHPCEIPENILAVKHSPGEFVVRFFGQYDHYWVNRGRVFPFQEGDSGKVSSQKSKIDAAFTMAMEHAQRACEILKTATPNEEESLDIASSLLPPHYVKLRVNKPCGALCGRRIDEESSLTQCECSPDDDQPCGPYTHCLNRMLLTECGPTCRAGDRCNNRAFEKRLYPKLVPYRTPYRGWGLKTLEDIKAGQFVIEYVGELIDEEEFQRRMRRKHEIRDENFYFLTLDKERMIDAGPKGNLARFMNHCCEPNCETQKWTVLGDVRVGLFALYDIPANSEVTFNYNLESAGIEKKRCLCGAKRCSGYIGAKLKQAEQPKKAKRPYNKKRKIDDSPSTSKNQVKPKPKLGRPPKPKELTDIEKDLLIIKNATNGISSDSDCSGRLSSIESIKDLKASKRKRVGHSTEELSSNNNSPSTKKMKLSEDKISEVCD